MKIEYYVEFGERSSHTGRKVAWLRGIEKFEGEIENFILNTFINFNPVKRFVNRSGVCVNDSTKSTVSECVVDS